MSTAEEIRTIITARDFGQFVGRREDHWFDAKRSPGYDLNTAPGRWELAKDVSAFANAEGGSIVIGLETTTVLHEVGQEEVVSSVLFPKAEFNESQIRGVLKEQLYPSLGGLAVEWVENAATPGLGIGLIQVPEQPIDNRFTPITRLLDEGEPIQVIAFGYAVRKGSGTMVMTADQIRRMCQEGRTSQAQRLLSIEAKLDHVSRQLEGRSDVPVETTAEKSRKRLERIISDD